MSKEDKILLKLTKKARLGNKEAFSQLIQKKARKILYLSIRLMGNAQDGEDAAQEAVIVLANKIGTLRNVKLFDAWMYRIVYNVCMDEKRKLSKRLVESNELEPALLSLASKDRESMPEQSLEDANDTECIMAALDKLPERYRMCMILYYYDGMSYAEIAETLSANEQIVANTLNRARQKMREILMDTPYASRAIQTSLQIEKDLRKQHAVSSDLEPHEREALYERVSKGASFMPATLIAQAIAADEASVVSNAALSKISAVAQNVVMPEGLLRSYVTESTATKAAAGSLGFVLVCSLGLYAHDATKLEDGASSTQTIHIKPEEQLSETEYEVSVVGLPEGARYLMIDESASGELQADQQNMSDYSEVTAVEKDGKRYVLYQNNSDELDYILLVEPE